MAGHRGRPGGSPSDRLNATFAAIGAAFKPGKVKPLLRDRPVHQPSYRLLDLPELFPQPLPNSVPQDQVAPASARSADVREAEEGEGFRLAEPLCLAVALRKAPEFDDPGLLRMQF